MSKIRSLALRYIYGEKKWNFAEKIEAEIPQL